MHQATQYLVLTLIPELVADLLPLSPAPALAPVAVEAKGDCSGSDDESEPDAAQLAPKVLPELEPESRHRTWAETMHARGINLRHLGLVREHVLQSPAADMFSMTQ